MEESEYQEESVGRDRGRKWELEGKEGTRRVCGRKREKRGRKEDD